MTTCQMKSSLSQTESRLVQEMQDLWFGDIEYLHVREGKPVFDPMPRFVRRRNLTGKRDSPRHKNTDFALKSQVLSMFEEISEVGSGVIRVIKVADGLPVHIVWHRDPVF